MNIRRLLRAALDLWIASVVVMNRRVSGTSVSGEENDSMQTLERTLNHTAGEFSPFILEDYQR